VAKSQCNGLDIVVNNAGTTYKKKESTTVTVEEFDKVVNVNIKSIFLSVKVVGPYFIEKKSGVFLNTSSVSGTRTRPGMVWYGGTKGFVNTVCIFLFIPFTLLHSPHYSIIATHPSYRSPNSQPPPKKSPLTSPLPSYYPLPTPP
jgi:hypothetical protein